VSEHIWLDIWGLDTFHMSTPDHKGGAHLYPEAEYLQRV